MGVFKKLASVAGVSAILPSLGLSAMDNVTGAIGAKYEMDLQQKAAKESFEQNRAWELEKFGMQKDYNNQMWERDKAYNAELWNKQNDYNSPKAQQERLVAAGLNPNLMYGQGTTGISTTIKSADPEVADVGDASMDTPRPRFNAESPGESLAKYVNIANAGLQNQNLSAQNSLIKQQRDRLNVETEKERYELDLAKKGGFSTKDPFYWRFGGRIANWLRGVDWDKTNDNMEKSIIRIERR